MTVLKLFTPSFAYYGRVIRLMLQYKGLDFELSTAPFGEPIQPFSEEHRRLHPFKKLPVLIDDEYVLNESIAMMEYINTHKNADHSRKLLPEQPSERAQCIAIVSHLNSDLHLHLVRNLILEFAFPKGEDKQIRFEFIDAHLEQANYALAWLEQLLTSNKEETKTPFLFGNHFTAADAYLLPSVDYLNQLPSPYNLTIAYPAITDYLSFHAQQAYCQGILGPAKLFG